MKKIVISIVNRIEMLKAALREIEVCSHDMINPFVHYRRMEKCTELNWMPSEAHLINHLPKLCECLREANLETFIDIFSLETGDDAEVDLKALAALDTPEFSDVAWSKLASVHRCLYDEQFCKQLLSYDPAEFDERLGVLLNQLRNLNPLLYCYNELNRARLLASEKSATAAAKKHDHDFHTNAQKIADNLKNWLQTIFPDAYEKIITAYRLDNYDTKPICRGINIFAIVPGTANAIRENSELWKVVCLDLADFYTFLDDAPRIIESLDSRHHATVLARRVADFKNLVNT